MQTALLTAFTLVAFAANSLLCRLALQPGTIDAASFCTIRLIAGAITLWAVSRAMKGGESWRGGSWMPAVVLFVYAVPFTFAYDQLSAGTGALILFGCVQVTMIAGALRSGERPHPLQWLGLVLSLAGLIYLVSPGITAPPLFSAMLMGVAGVFWGIYSLLGRGSTDPLAQTTSAFIRVVPFTLLLSLISIKRFHADGRGILLAAASGSIASGLGYVTWYSALRSLTATRAAVLQLSVPVLAAIGGVIFLAETVSARLLLSAVMVLGGIALAIVARQRPRVIPG